MQRFLIGHRQERYQRVEEVVESEWVSGCVNICQVFNRECRKRPDGATFQDANLRTMVISQKWYHSHTTDLGINVLFDNFPVLHRTSHNEEENERKESK